MPWIVGESPLPRVVDGRSEWPTAAEATAALDAYCDQLGLDPDDFTVQVQS